MIKAPNNPIKEILFGDVPEKNAPLAPQTFFRIVVLDVIYDPVAVTKERIDYYRDKFGLVRSEYSGILPRNTIVGKRVLDNSASKISLTRFFFPFFPPHISLPCMPGEHMWALLSESENVNPEYGFWFCRITEPWHVDDLNHTHPPRFFEPSFFPGTAERSRGSDPKFEFGNGVIEVDKDNQRVLKKGSEYIDGGPDAYVELITKENQINASSLIPPASVPRYKKRPGDLALEGTNNTLIVLGTDRNGPAAQLSDIEYISSNNDIIPVPSPKYPIRDLQYGSIELVAGRGQTSATSGETVTNSLKTQELNKVPEVALNHLTEGDPDLLHDISRIRISEKTLTDKNLSLSDFNTANFSIEDSSNGDGSIIVKSDKLRLVARKDIEILIDSGDSTDTDTWAALVIKQNGDIIFRPSTTGYIKLGSDSANKAILCADSGTILNGGTVVSPAISDTMAGFIGTGAPGQGTWARKVLVD